MTIETKIKNHRESNIELLRIILMLMIIGYHLILHGAYGDANGNFQLINESSVAYLFLKSFLVISVNCFVFISGFYRINFKIKPFLSLIFQTIFYSVVINLGVDMLSLEHVGKEQYLKALFPILFNTWWFVTAYLALYLLSPLLNSAIDTFNKKQFLFIILSLTGINLIGGFSTEIGAIVGANKGLSLLNFVHIYFIAQYIRKYEQEDKLTKYSSEVYIATSILVFLLAFLSITQLNQLGVNSLFAYNNPLVIIAAVSFFFIFKSIHIRSGVINSISPYMLGIYLFHDHPLTRQHLIENLFDLSQNGSAFFHFIYLFLITFLIFLAGFVADKFRHFALAPITKFVIERFKLERIEKIFAVSSR